MAAGEEPRPALAVAGGQEQVLLKRILTEPQWDSHVAELTFPAPVVLTTVRVGAVPSSAAQQQQTQLLLFAQDAGTPGAARFLQLCPGFEQPESGTRVVHLQPCVTRRVLLRGRYQTVPLSLYGFTLEEAAAAAPPPSLRHITLADALQWLRQQQQQEQGQQRQDAAWALAPEAVATLALPLQPAVEAVLAPLVAYWQLVGTSERLMALHPPPLPVFKAAAAVADAVCAQLVAGSFGREPLLAAEEAVAAAQHAEQPRQPDKAEAGGSGGGDAVMLDAEQAPPATPQQQQQQEEQQLLSGTELVEAAADMVFGWCAMLGAGAKGCTASAVRCGAASLAAAVLLCSCGEGARLMAARWGAVLLDDILTMPLAPPSFTRYAVAACLLIAHSCGTLGAASLLGLWRPPRGIVWQSLRRQQRPAAAAGAGAGAAAAAAQGGVACGEAGTAEGDAEQSVPMEEEVDEAAAAAAAEAAAELQQRMLEEQEEEQAGDEQASEAAAQQALLREQWRREREQDEAQLLYRDSDSGSGSEGDESEDDAHGYASDALREQQAAAVDESHAQQQQSSILDGAAAALQTPADQQQQAGGSATAGPAAMDAEDEFGGDVYADLASTVQGLPQPAPEAAAGAAGAAGAGDGGSDPAVDDLYGDLGAAIPQIDGAADSPPRRRRSGAADPAERWEMGDDGGSRSPAEKEGSGKHRHKERSGEKKKSKDKKKSKSKDRSRERKKSRDRSRDRSKEGRRRERESVAERERVEQQQREEEERQRREAAEARRRQRQEDDERRQRRQEEEKEERERRWRQREEEERRKRYLEQQRRLEEEQRQVEREAEERRRQEQRHKEEVEARRRQLRQQEEEEQRRRKRGRSPVAVRGAEGPQRGEPDGKQQRTDGGRKQQPRSDAQQQQQQQPKQQQPRSDAQQQQQQQQPKQQQPRSDAQQQQQPRRQQAPTQPPVPAGEAGKWNLHEGQQRSRRQSYWQLKQRAYLGISQHLVRLLLQAVQPQRLSLLARQLLHVLRAHEAAAAFQAAALELVQGHGGGQAAMPTQQAKVLVAEAAGSLQQLAELLAKPLPTAHSGSSTAGAPLFAGAAEPLLSLLQAVSARRLLPLLAAVLHVPALHRAAAVAALPAGVVDAAQQHAAVIELALAQQLGLGAKQLLAVLASSASGRRLLLGDANTLEQLLLATDAGCLAAGWRPAAASDGAATMQHLVIAESVTVQLCSEGLDSKEFAAAAETAAALLHECGTSGRRALVQALAQRASVAVPRLLLMLRMHCALLRAACGTGAAACPDPSAGADAEEQRQYEPDFRLLLAAAPACAPAPQLLLALLNDTHPGVLAHWQQHAVAVQVAAAAELQQLVVLPPAAAGIVAGLGSTKAALAGLQGAISAVLLMQQRSQPLPYLLARLEGELPELLPRLPEEGEEEEKGKSADGPGSAAARSVTWEAVEALFCDPEKLARCEQCLRLLASQLWAPAAAGRDAAYSVDRNRGLSVLLRAVLAGTELAEASAADDCWQVQAGHSIDVGEAAACRLRALNFLEAAAATMSGLLQHLRGSTCTVKGRSLLVGLLRAHAALSSQEESLACMLGCGSGGSEGGASGVAVGAEGMRVALAARYHLASCLRCYLEAVEPWQPPLMQQVFWGRPAAGLEPGQVAAQTPAEMFASACLLGDLFPPEWPAAGRKTTQVPPTDRRYRAALATAIEPCGASFRRLVAAALTSESRLLRSAVVRVLARAAGLGGGMGPFLVEPLLEELQTVAESPAPLHDARRLLEVLVPLVYRPAIKSAMLAAPFASTLAQLLGVVVGKAASADDGGEVAHVCTMAMEVVVALCSTEICLDPLASKEQQQLEDMPSVAEAAPLARALLELLPGMGANAQLAHRVLRLLAGAESGRQALRRGAVAAHAAATGTEQPVGSPSALAVAQAAQWVATRYWAAAEQLGSGDAVGGLAGMRAICADVVTIMQEICVAADEDGGLPKPSSAQQRFVAALQASLQAAAKAGLEVGGNEHRWEGPGVAEALADDLVHDPATSMFWRNVRARAAAQSQASAMHTMQRFARRAWDAGPEASLGTSLHPPLTLPRQAPELPPLVEQPARPQLTTAMTAPAAAAGAPKEEHQQQSAGTGRTSTALAATVPAQVKAEPTPARPSALPLQPQPAQQSMDLYADLDVQSQRSAGARSVPVVVAPAPQRQQQQQPAVQQASGTYAAPQRGQTPSRGASQAATVAGQQSEPAASSNLQALLSNPEALQALLKDPAQLQRLLEKHPALISVLKSTLGK